MTARLSLCGDDCAECPRYKAKTDGELARLAELWLRVGWRDRLMTPDEMRCDGCSPEKPCGYGLNECAKTHSVNGCNSCGRFPCDKTEEILRRSREYENICLERCTKEEYGALKKAFFNKEANLKSGK